VRRLSASGIGRFRGVQGLISILVSRFKRDEVQVHGHRMFLDPMDSLRLSITGNYEPFETSLVEREVRNGDVVLDIGANIGYYTLLFARMAGETGKVFAFEPDLANFRLLQRNVERNGYRNVDLVPQAVSRLTGRLSLFLSPTNMGDHRVYDSQDGRNSIQVDAIRLDDHFRSYQGRIDFIKMDIQGAEADALQGMEALLRSHRGIKLMTEFWPVGLKRAGTEPSVFLDRLLGHGFKLFWINERDQRVEPADIPRLLHDYPPERETYTHLWCVRSA
jgi:FkbM family methyltransferase